MSDEIAHRTCNVLTFYQEGGAALELGAFEDGGRDLALVQDGERISISLTESRATAMLEFLKIPPPRPKVTPEAVERLLRLREACPDPSQHPWRTCPECSYFKIGGLACGWRPPPKKEVAYAPPSTIERARRENPEFDWRLGEEPHPRPPLSPDLNAVYHAGQRRAIEKICNLVPFALEGKYGGIQNLVEAIKNFVDLEEYR